MRTNHENAGIRRSPGARRAGSALISLSFAVTLGATTMGCSGESVSEEAPGSGNDAAENALIQSHLEAHGYDTSTLQFDGDTVRVEDDMLVSRAVLLDEAEAEATGTVEKGYFLNGGKFAGKRVALSFQNGVSNLWKTALNTARDKWNSAMPLSRDPGAAGTITVQMVAMVDGRGTPLTSVIAEGSTPSSAGSVGRVIRVNSNFSSRTPEAGCGGTPATPVTIETLSASRKTYQALHEMGHVLGFAHPPPNPSNGTRFQIAGTAVSTTTSGDPSYSTVMAQGCKTLTSLSSDDGLSARKQYPGCIDTCETNCTFNVDPAQIGLCQASCPGQCGA
jgi:hypothetical protein